MFTNMDENPSLVLRTFTIPSVELIGTPILFKMNKDNKEVFSLIEIIPQFETARDKLFEGTYSNNSLAGL